VIQQFAPLIKDITVVLPEVLQGDAHDEWDTEFNYLVGLGLPVTIASYVAMPASLYTGLGMVEVAIQSGASPKVATETYFILGEKINLRWFAAQVSDLPVANYWQAMARETYMDDVEAQVRTIALSIIRLAGDAMDINATVNAWMNHHGVLIARWRGMISELQSAPGVDFAMFSVALRELLDLAQASQYCISLD